MVSDGACLEFRAPSDRSVLNCPEPSLMGSVAKRVREGIEALLFQSGKEDTVSEASIDEAVAFAQSVNAFDKPASERAKTISSAMLDFVSSSGRTSPTDSESYWTVDLSVGEREFLDTERTKELLDPITHTQRPKDDRVAAKLSCKSFGRDAAEVAASMLTSHIGNNLVIANLSDIIAGRPVRFIDFLLSPQYRHNRTQPN